MFNFFYPKRKRDSSSEKAEENHSSQEDEDNLDTEENQSYGKAQPNPCLESDRYSSQKKVSRSNTHRLDYTKSTGVFQHPRLLRIWI